MGGRRIPFVPVWEDEISIAHVQHLVVILCDWWPGLSVEVRCLGSGLPAVKLSHAEQRCIQVWDGKHTDEWRLMLGLKQQLFVYRHRCFCAKPPTSIHPLCLQEPPAALHISLFCIFGHFTERISKQPTFRLKTKTTSKWWVFVFKLNLCTLLEYKGML